MRRLLLILAIPLLASLSCNDATGPTSVVVPAALRAPQRILLIPSTTPQVIGGYYHTCALKADGTVVCWGDNTYGQATVPAGLASVAQLSPGGYHNCAVKTDGTVFCWGYDVYGQATVPDGLNSVAQVSGGLNHTCALKTDGTVICWGDNASGQTGVPEELVSVTEVSAGYLHTCALKADGTVVCWGSNGFGQASVPDGLASVSHVSAGTYHTCALKTDGTVVCWGYNGDGLTVPDGLASVAQVSAGGAHTCVLKTDGTVFCWGQNGFGQATVPDGLASVVELTADAAHSCALKTDGTVVCWGSDQFGQISVPDGLNLLGTPQSIAFTSSAPTPGLVGGSYSVSATGGASGNAVVFASLTESICTISGSNVTLVAAGTCTISASQAGGSGYQAAPDETQSFLVITPLGIPSPSAQITAGGYHTCASSVTGKMTCWGNNGYGQSNVPSGAASVSQPAAGYFHTCSLTTDGVVHCGRGDGTLQPMPALSQVAQIDAGEQYVMCALQTNRTVVCWGLNVGGNATVPSGLMNVAEVAVGHNHACALKGDGTVVCWGLNNEGETTPPSGLANVTQLSAGGFHTCALKADGTLACWGNNYFGESTVPSGLGGVVQVSAGYQHSCAVKNDSTLVCWGNSANGRTAIPANLPPVSKVSAGRYHTCVTTTAGNVVCWGDNGFGQTNVPAGLNVLGLQTINFTSVPPSSGVVGSGYNVAATGGGSGNAVTFSSLTPSTCSVTGSSVMLTAAGICTIAANQAAANGYSAAPQITQSISVVALLSISPSVGAGTYHSCALRPEGTVSCWGNNDENRSTPPAGLGSVAQLSVGNLHNCALLATRVVSCWGRNVNGSTDVPAGLSDVIQLSAGGRMTCVLKSTGSVQCWGADTDGQLNPPPGLNAVQVSAGGDAYGCALRTDATVVCWGFGGDGRTTVPVGLANVQQISTGSVHTCAVRNDGTVACWGPSPKGATVPVGLSNVVQLSAGGGHSCAVKSDGTVVCWGVNTDGQASPPLGLNNVQQVSAGATHTCARKTDGTIVCWGSAGLIDVPADLRPVSQAQSITFTSTPPSPALVATSYTVGATGGASGSPLVFTSLTPSVCTVSGNVASLLSEGTCMVAADQAGGNGYDPAPQNTQSFTVSMGPQAIVFTTTPSTPTFGGSYTVAATGGASGNAVAFSSLTPTVCTITGSSVSFVGAGSCSIAADQTGNTSYNAAPQATQTFAVAKAAQVITFATQPPSPAILGNSYAAAGTSSSGLPVTFTTSGSCSFSAGAVQLGSVGSCIVASHAQGNANYLDADGPSQTFPVIYNFAGFFPSVSNVPVVNSDKAGAVIKLKFSLGGDKGLNVIAAGSPSSGDISGNCATMGTPPITTQAIAGAVFKYDPTTGQYLYSWQTDSSWVGTCRQLILRLTDGTVHRANFQFSGTAVPTVVLSIAPDTVVAGKETTLDFAIDVQSPTPITAVGGVPCTLQPVLLVGATSYRGTCVYVTTPATPSGGVPSYVQNYTAYATIQGQSGGVYSAPEPVTIVQPPAPTVTLAVTPTQVTAGLPSTLTFTVSVTSVTPITYFSSTPCASGQTFQPALAPGATSYTGTCSVAQTFVTPDYGLPTQAYIYIASVNVMGRSTATGSNPVTVTVASPPPPTVTLTVTPTQVTAGLPSTLTFTVSVTSVTPITYFSSTPCASGQTFQPALAPGATSYTGTCSVAQTFVTPDYGLPTQLYYYIASVNVMGRSSATGSNAAAVTDIQAPAPNITMSVSPSRVTAGDRATLVFSVSASSLTPLTAVGGPCVLPAVTQGATSYSGSCSLTTTFGQPSGGEPTQLEGISAYASVLGRSGYGYSPAAYVTIVRRGK